ncbi:MAG: tripartite tricarboxylate transporter substrate binding protein [Limnohabitans sp.]|nr:tripartite tricarboxylate transporter substrate binding protein [Limnohabitans sp.]
MMFVDPRATRRTWLISAAALAAGGVVLPSHAQSAFRPTRPVKIISPLLPGGATDAIIRPIALKLSELWGQPAIVENRAGGGTIIGTQAVAQALPDGHTMGIAISAFTINPSLRKDLPYDTFKDITPITQIGRITSALVAHPAFPAHHVRDFIALAKAQPGAISWASLGVGTAGHITGELLRKRNGLDMVHVPFAGSSAAYHEILPGRIPVGFVVLESALPHVKAGKLKILAITDPQRSKLYPEIPVIGEAVPGLGYEGVFGLIGPGALPPDILRALHTDIVKVLALPEVRKRLEEQSMERVASTPAEFSAVIRREVENWVSAVKESGADVK